MSIFKENLDSKEATLKQSLHLSTEVTQKQNLQMNEMNQSLLQESQQDNILTVTGLEDVHAERFKTEVQEKYVRTQRQRDSRASDREIRKRAEKKTSSAIKLRKMLQELGNTGKSFDEIIKTNYTIFRINSFNKKNNPDMPEEDVKKYQTLKKQAPKVYERLLKLEHVMNILVLKDQKYQQLYQFAQMELNQARNEWEYVQHMANRINYKPTINKEAERRQLEARRKDVPKGEKHKRDKYTELDEAYKNELKENLKVDRGNPKFNLEADLDKLKKRGYLDDQAEMDFILTQQMNLIKKSDPEATPEKVQAVVTEYLKKLAEKSELRFRVHTKSVESILNTRYRSAYGGKGGKYQSLMEKQFSKNTSLKTHEAFSFGILGGKNAKEFSGFGSFDACRQFGKVSMRLNKEKMRGRATFTCGNSMGSIEDDKIPGMHSVNFYNIKRARSVYDDIDISNCGNNLASIYFRARNLKENDYKDLQSAEQEALKVIHDRGNQMYFECQFHGQVGPAEIDELTIVMSNKIESKSAMTEALKQRDMSVPMWDFSKMEDLDELKKSPDIKSVYDTVNIINKHPEEYGRDPQGEEMKVTVWDCYGHTISFDDLKFIMEKK